MHALSNFLPSSFGSEWAIQPEALVALEARVRAECGNGIVIAKQLNVEQREAFVKDWTAQWSGVQIDAPRIASSGLKSWSVANAARPGTVPKVSGAVAILPLHGVLVPKANEFTDLFGMTGMNRFGAMFQSALANESIKGIVIDVDSPGGTVAGTAELANLLYESRTTSNKPTVAVANGLAASAAYWIATSAKSMIVSPSGEVGSVGVFMVHTDYSESLKQDGIKPTLIHAGKYKVEANPYEPLSDEGREYLQASVDESYENFVSALVRNRGETKAHVLSKFGEGRMLRAKPAREANMVDRVQTMQQVLQGMGVTRVVGASAEAHDLELAAALAEAGNVRDESNDQPAIDVDLLRRRVRLREREAI